MKKNKGIIMIIILTLILAITIITGAIKDKALIAKNKKEIMQMNELDKKERDEKQRISNLNIYEKLKENKDINILVAGDGIAAQVGLQSNESDWVYKLQNYLINKYHSKANINNISAGLAISYDGYNKVMKENLNNYDLVILCYGQNDRRILDVKKFNITYEALIRQIRLKNPNCDIIPIIESSLKEYNGYANSIINISKYYGFNYADTIKGFNESGLNYSQLTADGVFPNEKGYDIYFNTIKDIIDTNVLAEKKIKNEAITPYDLSCTVLDTYKFIDKKNMNFKNNVYTIETTGSFIGLSYSTSPSYDIINVYINDVLIKKISTNSPFKNNISTIIADNLTGKNIIKLEIIQEDKNTEILGLITNELE